MYFTGGRFSGCLKNLYPRDHQIKDLWAGFSQCFGRYSAIFEILYPFSRKTGVQISEKRVQISEKRQNAPNKL
jgi:hypothetical protein